MRYRLLHSVVGLFAFAGVCFIAAGASGSTTTEIVLLNDNSQITLNPQLQDGIYRWQVDGKNYLQQQWWWYRIGPSGPEASVDTLNMAGSPVMTDTNGDGKVDTAVIDYSDSQNRMTLEFTYSLRGGAAGSGVSDLGEQIVVNNTSGSVLSLHLYQYVHMMLSDGADSVEFDGKSQVTQTDSTGAMYAEELVTGKPQYHEAALYPGTPGTLINLNDSDPTTLSNVDSAGPGDVTWAFQWDRTISANGTCLISKDKTLTVPEPATLALMGGGLTVAMALRRRRR